MKFLEIKYMSQLKYRRELIGEEMLRCASVQGHGALVSCSHLHSESLPMSQPQGLADMFIVSVTWIPPAALASMPGFS